jgi:hypothetical protein
MLVTAFIAPTLSVAFTTAAVAASARARRLLAKEYPAFRAAIVMSLFTIAAVTAWVPPAVVTGALGAVATIALWTAGPVRRRWGDPLPRGPRWDWDRFDAAFRLHVERMERRERPRGPSDA